MFKRFASLVTMVALVAILFVPQSTQAFFWRTAGSSSGPYTSPNNPTVFSYGYGFGSAGYGYGYGYGYSYYASDKSGTGYYGAARQLTGSAGSATVSSNISTNTADFSQVVSGNTVTTTGGGTITLTSPSDSNLTVAFPSGTTFTASGGTWDGIVQAPIILSSVDSDYLNLTDSEIILYGSNSVNLTISPAVTIKVRLKNYIAGNAYTIRYFSVGSSDSVAETTCGTSNISTDGTNYYCSLSVTHFTRFFASLNSSSTPVATTTTGGGGGGGAAIARCKDKITKKWVTGKEGKDGYCEGKKVTVTTPVGQPKAPEAYKAGEVAAPFKDVGSHWAKDFIETLRMKGVIHGKKVGLFVPNDQLTRAELTKIALNAFGIPVDSSVSTKPFSDVEVSAWYAPFVAKAKELNIVSGYNNGTFKPNQNVNRVEALKILIAASGMEVSMDNLNSLAGQGWSYIHFIDTPIKAWYAAYVDFAKTRGIVSGYGNGRFGPENAVLRGEVAKMTVKLLEESNK